MTDQSKAIEAAARAYGDVSGEHPWTDGLEAAITAFLRNVVPSEAMIDAGGTAISGSPAIAPRGIDAAFKAMAVMLADELEKVT